MSADSYNLFFENICKVAFEYNFFYKVKKKFKFGSS